MTPRTDLHQVPPRALPATASPTIDDRFDVVCGLFPDAVAVEAGGKRLRYGEISAASWELAENLISAGVGPGDVVGVCLERSAEFVVAVLAILRCGAAYAPLPGEYPLPRLLGMIDDAGIGVLVAGGSAASIALALRGRRDSLTLVRAEKASRRPGDPSVDRADLPRSTHGPETPAYVMFTSGSTGKPRGVVVPHRAVIGLVTGQDYADFGPRLRTLLLAPTAFDASTFEVWGPLLNGGATVVVPDGPVDPHRLGGVIRSGNVNTVWLTTGLFNMVIDHAPEALATLSQVITGGESASLAHIHRAVSRIPSVRLTHAYGPTETTTFATTHEINPLEPFQDGVLPIGRPLAHTTCLIMSAEGEILPDGATGELWIGGSGVALGYLNVPEGGFVPDPRGGHEAPMMYRSGDLARWLPSGDLEYLGRIDQQVKIRGHRVEPGEIEGVLHTHPAIKSVAVLPFQRADGTALAAFIVPHDGQMAPMSGLHDWLAERLPAPMIPARFVAVPDLPLTPNGKLDREALLVTLSADASARASGEPPRVGTEAHLAGIVHRLVGGVPPSRDDDFFSIGGNSLLAMRLVAAVEKSFGVRLPVLTIFETRSVARMAAAIAASSARETIQSAADVAVESVGGSVGEALFFPALPAQRGMWALDAILSDRAMYLQPFALRAGAPVDWDLLRRALQRAIDRHPALRTSLVAGELGPVQAVRPPGSVAVPWSEVADVDEESLPARLVERAGMPFDLAEAPLWRVTLFPHAAPYGLVLFVFHHAIIDDWSIDVLFEELSAHPDLPESAFEPTAAGSMLPSLGSAQRESLKAFWTAELASASGEIPWPGVLRRTPPDEAGPRGGLLRFRIESDLQPMLRAVAESAGATDFQVLLAAFHAWIHRVSGAEDVVIGTPVSLRRSPEVQSSINCFLNTLPVRLRWADGAADSGVTFAAIIEKVKVGFLAAVAHGELPFDEIVSAAWKGRQADRSALVSTLFVATAGGRQGLSIGGTRLEPIPIDNGSSKFDLTLFLDADADGFAGTFEFDRRRFDDATIVGFAAMFPLFLRSLLAAPGEPVHRAKLLDAAERRRMIVDFGDGGPPAAEAGLVDRFRTIAATDPDAIAVSFGVERLSYGDLSRQAEKIAAGLRSAGMVAGSRVGIFLPRSLALPTVILGVVTAGAGAVPLDPLLPRERLASMTAIARCGAILTDCRMSDSIAAVLDLLPSGAPKPLILDVDALGMATLSPPDDHGSPPAGPAREDLLYVLFTSGSTGVPKGVEMTHGPIANLVSWQCRRSGIGRRARTLQFASAGFDVAFQEIFSTWLSGGELVIVPEEARLDPLALLALVIDRDAERVFVPAAVLEHVAEAGLATGRLPSSLREVIVAGEQLRIGSAIRAFLGRIPGAILWNQYGPTESHVVTSQVLDGGPSGWPALPPIGTPIPGVVIRVLDASMEPVPQGVSGEIWIGGECLARGYAGRPDLTAERFVDDPFVTVAGRRIYRTGDLGRWNAAGHLEYLGRVDRQVKIRGHRVEPDEVEAMLATHPSVSEAAVIVRLDDRGECSLSAFVVPAPGMPIPTDGLLSWLGGKLPAASVPETIRAIDALPLSPNGKVDRRQLECDLAAEPALQERIERCCDRPLPGPELLLAEIWLAVLRRGMPGRHDDFFRVGGTSLSAMRLVAAIERGFGVRLPVRSIFETPRLADLAARIAQPAAALPESAVALMTVPASVRTIDCRALPTQRGMKLLHELLPDPAAYNVPIAWCVRGPIEWPRLGRALAVVAARHPALRTSLVEVDGVLLQRVSPQPVVNVCERALSRGDDLDAALRAEASIPFDLSMGPLWRAARFEAVGADPVLMLTFHHAVIDEWSIGILRDELAEAYRSDAPDPVSSLPVVTAAASPADLERQRRFWRDELAGAPPETPLPRRSTAGASMRGETCQFAIEADVLARLRGVAASSDVTLFHLLLAATHAWLARITGERDLVIGTPVATRGSQATAGAVGCLITVLPVRLRQDGEEGVDALTMPQLAGRVREAFLRAIESADLPFDQIVAAAVPGRHGRRQPLVNVLLTVVESGQSEWRIGPATLTPVPIDIGLSRFDLSLTLDVGPAGIRGALEYAADALDNDFVAGSAARFAAFLSECAAGPTVPIGRMSMLPRAELQRVTADFNDTVVDLGPAATLHELVADQAARTPAAWAVSEGSDRISYADLVRHAAALAERLRGLSIGPGARVAIAVPRSIDAIVSMLAVLRTGAAWVAIDRDASEARAAFIVADVQPAAIIAPAQAAQCWPTGVPVVDPAGARGDFVSDGAFPVVDPAAPAYVMYTSGSTGQPKGVVIPHASIVNYLRGKQRRFPLGADDVFLHSTRTTFDIALYEVFGALLAGAMVVILPPGRLDPAEVVGLMKETGVTVGQFVPSLLGLLVDLDSFADCTTLRRVFCGGEAMSSGLMEGFIRVSRAELINVYGPTEATVWATAWECRGIDPQTPPPIGRPLDNVCCYLLDSGGRPVPVGAAGELHIGGSQLAIGYHRRPELTAERFLPDPFTSTAGARMYRTGDICRWRGDGVLEFLARTDQQVKIRGHRIEPAEIEACLLAHPEVASAAVVVIVHGAEPTLVAAVVGRGPGVAGESLRRWVAERLPEVMVPARVVPVDALPLNPNGKIDRGALATRLAETAVHARVCRPIEPPPRSVRVLEAQVRGAWQRVFGRVDFVDDDNFFHDLGGQSILAARLVADLSAILGRRVPLAAVFEAPTVTALAALLREEGWRPRFRSIVPLQPLGSGPPLILFHGVGGGISEILELARALAPDVPVHGVQAMDRDGGEMLESLEAFGAIYAAEIVAFQPKGPYFLGGFSLGGWFAYETARQLRLAGHDVALLAQFDTHVNCSLPDEVVADAERTMRRQYFWKHFRRVMTHPARGWSYLRKLRARLTRARRWRVADPIGNDRHGTIVANHRALPYPGRIDYFRSAESLPAVLGVWQRLCRGGVRVYEIPGEHHEVIFGANAATVATIIRGVFRDRTPRTPVAVDAPEQRQA